jgi:transcription antitermination protein NusB
MKARSAMREISFYLLFQFEKQQDLLVHLNKTSVQEWSVTTVRAMTALAEEQLQAATQALGELYDYAVDTEIDHPSNENLPLHLPTQTVPLPKTKETCALVQRSLNALEALQEALYLPELQTLIGREDIQNGVLHLLRETVNRQAHWDEIISANLVEGWRLERLQKAERNLLRLALAEHHIHKTMDTASLIDEWVELSKQFTDDEGRKLIHGILGSVFTPTEQAHV